MAYSTRLSKTCVEYLCEEKAKAEVFNCFNGSMGYFCNKHASKKVDEQNKFETEDRKKRDDS